MDSKDSSTRQAGFSLGIVLGVILFIAALILGGWYIWNDKKEKPETTKSNQEQSKHSTPSKETPKDPSEGGKYLVIKEWGVRLPLLPNIQGDAYYDYESAVPTYVPGITIETIKLRSKKLDKILAECSEPYYLSPGISRSKTKLLPEDHPYAQAEPAFINIEGYWYDSFSPGRPLLSYACPDPETVSQSIDTFRASVGTAQDFYDLLPKLELIE